jgi:hypothetical protein
MKLSRRYQAKRNAANHSLEAMVLYNAAAALRRTALDMLVLRLDDKAESYRREARNLDQRRYRLMKKPKTG